MAENIKTVPNFELRNLLDGGDFDIIMESKGLVA
jgi:hypothetical protein